MKKRRLKRWQKIVIGIVVTMIVIVGGVFAYDRIFGIFRVPSGQNRIVQSSDANYVVQTQAGQIGGQQEGNVISYLGVPYAQATERFVRASAVTSWEGVYQASEYGKISPQGALLGMPASNGNPDEDNNSQNLNIWTPGVNDGEKRPVMVWLHGGGFSLGSANDRQYNGADLAGSQDVVVVGVNHRLNVYGYFDLTAYGEKYADSDNVGMWDIVDALQWIQANIEQFGGDPNNVTVFGQSGGGAKVLTLMSSPEAKGLFQKGIVQSGATDTMGVSFSTTEISRSVTEKTLQKLGITASNIEDIQ